MTTSSSNEHIVMLPYMALGHLIPFLSLAKQLERRTNFTISIVSTPLNIRYLRSTTSTASIRLVELPFSASDHDLPPNTENTENLGLRQIINLLYASLSLETPFRRYLTELCAQEGKPPICIISDVFFGWAVAVARSIGTVNITFSTGGAYGTAAYVSLWRHLPHRNTDSDEFSLPGFPDTCRFHRSQLHKYLLSADGSDEWSKLFGTQITLSLGSYGWLCNTTKEIEPLGLDIFERYAKLPIWTIGPLLPQSMLSPNYKLFASDNFEQRVMKEPGVSPEKIIKWLHSHSENSVLYISFGSQNTMLKVLLETSFTI